MVNMGFYQTLYGVGGWLLLAQQKVPLIQRLDPKTRVKVLAALAGLVILGFGMVLLTWLGGRATRRYLRSTTHRASRITPPSAVEDDWAEKPLVPDATPRPRQKGRGANGE
jgi:hypothetical protein